jgi:muramoyltetrapeptide carboxypeptidase
MSRLTPLLPRALAPGATIGLVSPGRWSPPDDLARGVAALEGMGYRVKVHPQNHLRHHQFAGTDDDRAAALEDIFADPDVHAVVCARGGTGSLRLLDRLNYGLIGRNPKILMGYSDITALLVAVREETGLVTYHGPMAYSFSKAVDPFTRQTLVDVLSGTPNTTINAPATVLQAGMAEGPLLGGNLCLLTNLIGTPHDFSPNGHILFLEDVDEYWHNLDRMFLHLKRAGRLRGIRGLILGELTDMKDGTVPYGLGLADLVRDYLEGAPIPIVTDFPCGHGKSIATFPLGVDVRFTASDGRANLVFLQPTVTTERP